MGAWGLGPLENDNAVDFVADIEDDADSVARVLDEITGEVESDARGVEAPAGAIAVALGALVTGIGIDDDRKWMLAKVRSELNRDQLAYLRSLVFRVMHGPDSELAELHEEAGHVEEWRAQVQPILEAWPEV